MMQPKRASRAAAFLLGATAILCAACGGVSTAGGPTPVNDAGLFQLIQANTSAWIEWKQGPGLYVDRDFFECFEISGAPRPLVTPVPDPSGHSRARRGCDEAIGAVEQALDKWEDLADELRTVTVIDGSANQPRFIALRDARLGRVQWAKDVVAAWKKQDIETLRLLHRRLQDIVQLENKALQSTTS